MPYCPRCNTSITDNYTSATDAEYFTTNEVYQYFECNTCEIIFIDPMPADQLQIIYPANYYSFTTVNKSIAFKIKDWLDGRFHKKILKQSTGKSLRALDIGGGTGTALDTLIKADSRITFTQVIDIDKQAQVTATAKGHHYFCGTIETFNDTLQYDVILMLNLIEHVANPLGVLAKAAAMLSKDGVIILKTPNYKSLDATLFKKSYWGGLHCPRHWILFTKKSIDDISNEAGLKTSHFFYTQGAPFWSFSILQWLHQRKVIKANRLRPLIYHPLFFWLSAAAAIVDFIRKPFAPLSQMFFVLRQKEMK